MYSKFVITRLGCTFENDMLWAPFFGPNLIISWRQFILILINFERYKKGEVFPRWFVCALLHDGTPDKQESSNKMEYNGPTHESTYTCLKSGLINQYSNFSSSLLSECTFFASRCCSISHSPCCAPLDRSIPLVPLMNHAHVWHLILPPLYRHGKHQSGGLCGSG